MTTIGKTLFAHFRQVLHASARYDQAITVFHRLKKRLEVSNLCSLSWDQTVTFSDLAHGLMNSQVNSQKKKKIIIIIKEKQRVTKILVILSGMCWCVSVFFFFFFFFFFFHLMTRKPQPWRDPAVEALSCLTASVVWNLSGTAGSLEGVRKTGGTEANPRSVHSCCSSSRPPCQPAA